MAKEKTERIIEAAPRVVIPTQLVYTFIAIVFALNALEPIDMVLRLEYGIGVLVCIWLIHCRRYALCVCRDEEMVITVAATSLAESLAAGVGRRRYVTVPYTSVAGIGANWRQLLLANASGGLTMVPVDWHEMRPADRRYVVKRIEEARRDAADD